MSMSSVNLDVKETRKTALIANFTNGDLNVDHSDELDIEHYICENKGPGKKTNKHMLVAETDRVRYVGQNYGQSANSSKNLCSYYVGLLDKKTGKMQICDTEIFQMFPKFTDDDSDDSDEPDSKKLSIPTNLNYSQRKDILTESFGSRKKQKALESRLKNQGTGDDLKQSLGSAASRALKLDKHIQSQTGTEAEDSITPPCNKDALRSKDVYNLHDVISARELEDIEAVAEKFYDSAFDVVLQWRKESKYPTYILSRLSVLPMTEKERWKKVKCLMYLHYMFNFYNLKPHQLRQGKIPLPDDIPDEIRKSFLEKYTMKVERHSGSLTRCRPAKLKDKLLAHILVLCLMVDEFEFEFSELLADLKVPYQRLLAVFGTLGCSVISKKAADGSDGLQRHFAVLRIPLTFPSFRTGSRKKRQ